MSDEKFLLEYEKLLNEGYCDCNEMNCIDNDSPRRILKIAKNLQQENEELKKQLKISETNEETYYLEIKGIAEALELNENSIVEDIYQKILGLKNQQKMFIEWLEKEIENCKYGEENYADGDDMTYHNENELRKEILSK